MGAPVYGAVADVVELLGGIDPHDTGDPMGHAQRLTNQHVRGVFRLLGEVRELGGDCGAWRSHLVTSMCGLVGATVGISVEAGWHPGQPPKVFVMVDLGWSGAAERADFQNFLRGDRFASDPAFRAVLPFVGRDYSFRREQLVDGRTWYAAPTVNDGRRIANIDDTIHSSRVLPTPGGADDLALHRPWKGRRFNERERLIVELFHDELAHVWRYQAGRNATHPLRTLPPQLGLTLRHLLGELSEKEIAARMRLSPHSVHAYAKVIYQRLSVTSRPELMARYVGRPLFNPELLQAGS